MTLKMRQHECFPPPQQRASTAQGARLPAISHRATDRAGTSTTLPGNVRHRSTFCQLSKGCNLTIWETTFTLYIREVSRRHVPKYPGGPAQQHECPVPEDQAGWWSPLSPRAPRLHHHRLSPFGTPAAEHPNAHRTQPQPWTSLSAAQSISAHRESPIMWETCSQKLADNADDVSLPRAEPSGTNARPSPSVSNSLSGIQGIADSSVSSVHLYF